MLFNLFLSFPIALLLIRFLMDIQSLVVDSDIGGAIIGRSEIDVIADYCNKFQQQKYSSFQRDITVYAHLQQFFVTEDGDVDIGIIQSYGLPKKNIQTRPFNNVPNRKSAINLRK
jgi:hypothetical protein